MSEIVKEIQIDKGAFAVKSPKTGKFSAHESYKEHLLSEDLPTDAPKDFKEALPNLYYSPVGRELISYRELHNKIHEESENILASISSPTDEDKKKSHIEASKKILKENGINEKTYLLYSPYLTGKLKESDEFCRVSATYNHDEKIMYLKTKLLKSSQPKPIHIEDFIMSNIKKVVDVKEEQKKIDVEELKKKYNFKRPKGESLSEIVKKATGEHIEQPVEKKEEPTKEPIIDNTDPYNKVKNIISDSLHSLVGKWVGNTFKINFRESGYLLPVSSVEIMNNNVYISSSSFTNIEWWTKFTPNTQCPRYLGHLDINDSYSPYCFSGKCIEACGAEDGFVELSAARFRLLEDAEIIKSGFKRLQEFLDRVFRLSEEFNQVFGVNINIDLKTQYPFFHVSLPIYSDESTIRNNIEALFTLYHEITDIRGRIDIEQFFINDDYDAVSEDGLIQESKNYGLQEMVRLATKDLLEEIMRDKNGEIDGKFYLIDRGRMRFILKSNRVEAIRDELYMGNVTYNKGLKEVQEFLHVILGGGRW